MKQILKIAASVVALMAPTCVAFAAQPTVMLLPDKTWANKMNYGTTEDHRGKKTFVIDYDKCYLDADLKNVLSAVTSVMQDNGLNPKNYNAQNEEDDFEDMVEEAYDGSDDDATLKTSSFDDILNKAKPDILVQVGWDKHPLGFNYSISWRMTAVDSYSNKDVATITGESQTVPSSTALSALLKNAANAQMSQFIRKLQDYFDDVQTKGREIRLNVRAKGNSGINLDSEFGGKPLVQIISDWLYNNTVNNQYNERTTTPNRASYDEIRIPCSRNMNARAFVQNLANFLRSNYNIKVENRSSGLGVGRLYID